MEFVLDKQVVLRCMDIDGEFEIEGVDVQIWDTPATEIVTLRVCVHE